MQFAVGTDTWQVGMCAQHTSYTTIMLLLLAYTNPGGRFVGHSSVHFSVCLTSVAFSKWLELVPRGAPPSFAVSALGYTCTHVW